MFDTVVKSPRFRWRWFLNLIQRRWEEQLGIIRFEYSKRNSPNGKISCADFSLANDRRTLPFSNQRRSLCGRNLGSV